MMFARLKELTRSDLLDVSGNPAKLAQQTASNKNRENRILPLPLPRRVMALLIQYPELINKVEQKEIFWECLEFPGVQLFKDILADVLENKPANTAILLEHYRNHPNEKIATYLASLNLFVQDQKVDADGIEKEFNDALDNLLVQAKKEADFQKLVAKDKKH
jgi:DNA primase